MDAAVAQFGAIDVLVNCAGIIKHLPIEEMSLEAFESVVRVNLTGTFLCCRAVVPVMKKQGRGKIVNMASLAGRTGRPGVGVNYAASKAGVIALTQTLAREAGPRASTSTASPRAPILTELTKQVGPEVFAKWNVGRAVKQGRAARGRGGRGPVPGIGPVGLDHGRHPGHQRRHLHQLSGTQGGAMAKVKVVDIKNVAGERRDPPRTSWILVSEKTVGSKNLAMGVNETDPGSMVPEHKHDTEEEVMFFISGRGNSSPRTRRSPSTRASASTTPREGSTRS